MSLIEIINKWKHFFLLLSIIPIVLIGMIYIVYGDIINPLFVEKSSLIDFLKLSNQHALFSSEISLPFIVKSLGSLSTIMINTTFLLWLFMHVIITSQHIGNKVGLVIELLIIASLYFLIISPKSIIIYILGTIIIIADLALIASYWFNQIKTGNEKQ